MDQESIIQILNMFFITFFIKYSVLADSKEKAILFDEEGKLIGFKPYNFVFARDFRLTINSLLKGEANEAEMNLDWLKVIIKKNEKTWLLEFISEKAEDFYQYLQSLKNDLIVSQKASPLILNFLNVLKEKTQLVLNEEEDKLVIEVEI